MPHPKQAWILAGYEIFAKEGPAGLKVEVMARRVGKNKSSFYHYFADIEVFTAHMLKYHLERSEYIAELESQCTTVVPELLQVLVAHKQDLLFNRQLRVHRDVSAYRDCFEKSSSDVGEAILPIWSEAIGLSDNSHLAMMVLQLSLENFYLQITDKTLTVEWLTDYVQGLKRMVQAFDKKVV